MPWYRTGTVAVTNGSKNITGTDTLWSTAINPGDTFTLEDSNGNPTGAQYEVVEVTSNTAIVLRQSYAGTTGSNKQYAIFNLVGNMTTPRFAQRLASFFDKFSLLQDQPTTTPTPSGIPVAGSGGTIDPDWIPDATTSAAGKVELATAAETQAGTDATRAVTPAGLFAGTNVLKVHTGGTYYLSPSGNDTTGNGSSGNPWYSLAPLAAELNNSYMTGNVLVYFADGAYSWSASISFENIYSNNFKIGFIGAYPEDSVVITGDINIQFWNCLTLNNATFNLQSRDTSGNSIAGPGMVFYGLTLAPKLWFFGGSAAVRYCKFTGISGVTAYYNCIGVVNNCTFATTGASSCIGAANGARMTSYTNVIASGATPTYGLIATNGGIITKVGAQPTGAVTADEYPSFGGVILAGGSIS